MLKDITSAQFSDIHPVLRFDIQCAKFSHSKLDRLFPPYSWVVWMPKLYFFQSEFEIWLVEYLEKH